MLCKVSVRIMCVMCEGVVCACVYVLVCIVRVLCVRVCGVCGVSVLYAYRV